MKAQDTLAGYNSSSTMTTQVSESISLAETQNQNSSVSELTDAEGFNLINVRKRSVRGTDCSRDSSVTSSESSGKKDEKLKMVESEDTHDSLVLPSMEIDQNGSSVGHTESSIYRIAGKKRSRSSISDETCVEQPLTKRSTVLEVKPVGQLKKLGLFKEFDLNSKYQSEVDSGLEELDLNCGVSNSI
ncbi:hypothetical protein BVC80_1753g16 [Macleaya cordata]|uniref:Uncharacterized protein n=1 Tax=Macleaya cordata TaxID=56857 RepID=A0A200QHD7_MACCD|nr:hypothetical protein BVC80_1753g16 [Macleaya cordata]